MKPTHKTKTVKRVISYPEALDDLFKAIAKKMGQPSLAPLIREAIRLGADVLAEREGVKAK
jgi:hypothetical protein